MNLPELQPAREAAFIALGSNLGEPRRFIREALARLAAFSDSPILVSSLWRSSPVDCPPDSPAFLNAVAGMSVRTGETPESLLIKLQALEREFGRRPKVRLNEPRPLDLDLIAFGAQTRQTAGLILPHPRACVRKFVLYPLSEIAPELILPGQTKTILALRNELASSEQVERFESLY